MNELLTYLCTVACLQLIFWSIYRLTLYLKGRLVYERFFLLGSLLLSLILPHIHLSFPQIAAYSPSFTLENVLIYGQEGLPSPAVNYVWLSISFVYALGIAIHIVRLATSMHRLYHLIHSFPVVIDCQGYQVRASGGVLPTASFFRTLIWDDTRAYEKHEADLLLAHEACHIRDKHFLDLLLVECIQAICWFCPGIYLIKRDLRLVHELSADQASLQVGSKATLAKLILAQLTQSPPHLILPFAQSPLARRVAFLQLTFHTKYMTMRKITSVFLVLGISIFWACTPETPISQLPALEQSLTASDQHDMTSQLDRDPEPLNLTEIRQKIGYPKLAIDAGLEAELLVRVQIDEMGSYVQHEFSHTPAPVFTEAIEKHLPGLKFRPAIQEAQAVSTWVTIPFRFKLISFRWDKPQYKKAC